MQTSCVEESIAAWNTPCNSRRLQPGGTRTRRHALMPVGHTLIGRIASASDVNRSVFSLGKNRFGRRVIPYRLPPVLRARRP
jgi:hypothetical protein